MQRVSLTLISAAALGLAACTDPRAPVGPAEPDWNLAQASTDRETTVYSNFGPNMAFDMNPFHAYTINGFLGPAIGQQAISEQFTPSGDYVFSDAQVALTLWSGPDNMRVYLQADDSGRPGAVMEQISVDGLGTTPLLVIARSELSPVLHEGTPYWLTVTAGASGVVGGWSWNSIGDVSGVTFAVTQGGGPAGPWAVGLSSTRSVFKIDGRSLRAHGPIVHAASGGGTVLWSTGGTVTYGITARQMADGTTGGQFLFSRRGDVRHYKGTVTCLSVVGNRAYMSGELTQTPEVGYPYFAIGVEDNGEGANAVSPDRISGMILMSYSVPCYRSFPVANWTHGNAQVR